VYSDKDKATEAAVQLLTEELTNWAQDNIWIKKKTLNNKVTKFAELDPTARLEMLNAFATDFDGPSHEQFSAEIRELTL